MSSFLPTELISKKKSGLPHTQAELSYIVNEFISGRFPEYQMSAWLMAVYFKGMTRKELAQFTLIMKDTGHTLKWNPNLKIIDKHSTGGVGDKTSLLVGPIAAAAGVPIAMIAGRGLGHTGGTLDKLESIPGFKVQLTQEQFQSQVQSQGLAIMSQTTEICPADRMIYSLRDVTSTVDSLPLICSSIMSKKLAEGLAGLVLDVKFGSGAFMKTPQKAKELAKLLQSVGHLNGLPITALLTNMNQPLGQFIGNALEVNECVRILQGEKSPFFNDTRELSLVLASYMILMSKKAPSLLAAKQMAEHQLDSGQAWNKWLELCKRQGGIITERLAVSNESNELRSPLNGYIKSMNVEEIGMAAVILGAGRRVQTDSVNPSVGIECLVKVGSKVKKGDLLFRFYGSQQDLIEEANERVKNSLTYSRQPTQPIPLIKEVLIPLKQRKLKNN